MNLWKITTNNTKKIAWWLEFESTRSQTFFWEESSLEQLFTCHFELNFNFKSNYIFCKIVKLKLTSSNAHEKSGEDESQRETRILIETLDVLAQVRWYQGGDGATATGRPEEDGKEVLQLLVLVRLNELVAAQCRDARFNTARSQCDDQQPRQWKQPSQNNLLIKIKNQAIWWQSEILVR